MPWWFASAWALPLTLGASLVARCLIVSRKRLLFGDEFFTWYPVSAPFRSMLASTTDNLNTSPPLYFILTWAWAHVFGNSAVSLRLASALTAAAAILLMFAVLRQAYGALASAAALTVAFMDPELLAQSVEARFYMLMLAEIALCILLYQRLMQQSRPSIGWLVANAVAHASLVMTHYFGLVYSGVILGAVLLTCLARKRSPLRAAASIVAGWTVFLPWIPVLLRHLQMGKPTFWIPVPTIGDLGDYYRHYLTGDFWLMATVLCGFATVAVIIAAIQRDPRGGSLARLAAVRREEVPLLILAPLFGFVPVVIYVISTRHTGPSSFLDRYMLPGALAWAILCAHLSNRIFRLGSFADGRRAARALPCAQLICVTLLVGWCGWSVVQAALATKVQAAPAVLPSTVPRGEPIVVEYIHEFMGLHFYSPESQRYLFVVDPQAGINAGAGEPANQQVMAALKRNFPDRFREVVFSEEFLASTTGFWVKVHTREWWQTRIANSPTFVCDRVIASERLAHVTRRR